MSRCMSGSMRRGVRHMALRWPWLKRGLLAAEGQLGRWRHGLASRFPQVIRARSTKLTVAITAACNQSCRGCCYGRGFMDGHELPLPMVRELLDDAWTAGVRTLRLYGGEPLLHRDLPAMVEHAVGLGFSTYVTTNGILLGDRASELHRAGLRAVTIGYYGTGAAYDDYVGRRGSFARLERSLSRVRALYGAEIGMQLNYLIMPATCHSTALEAAVAFAKRHGMTLRTDLVHSTLPYFTDGSEPWMQFRATDAPAIHGLVAELLRLRKRSPGFLTESEESLRAIPDWLLRPAQMCVPCDAYKLLWVGADGGVQLCYVKFRLGNLRERRLREMLYTPEHHDAARAAFRLECPHCHCEREDRIRKHGPSRSALRDALSVPLSRTSR